MDGSLEAANQTYKLCYTLNEVNYPLVSAARSILGSVCPLLTT